MSLLCAPRFNLNFAPAKPKAALRFFKVTRGELYRTVIWHIYSRGFVHVIRAVYIRRTYRSPLLFQPRLLSRSFACCYAVSRDGYYFEDYTLLSLCLFPSLSLSIIGCIETPITREIIRRKYFVDFKIFAISRTHTCSGLIIPRGDETRLTRTLSLSLLLSLALDRSVFRGRTIPRCLRHRPPSRLNPTYPKSVRGKFQLQFAIS